MKTFIPLILLVSILLVSGCTAPQTAPATPGDTIGEPAAVQNVGQGLSDIGDLGTDLNTTDLNELEQDLGDLTW